MYFVLPEYDNILLKSQWKDASFNLFFFFLQAAKIASISIKK